MSTSDLLLFKIVGAFLMTRRSILLFLIPFLPPRGYFCSPFRRLLCYNLVSGDNVAHIFSVF